MYEPRQRYRDNSTQLRRTPARDFQFSIPGFSRERSRWQKKTSEITVHPAICMKTKVRKKCSVVPRAASDFQSPCSSLAMDNWPRTTDRHIGATDNWPRTTDSFAGASGDMYENKGSHKNMRLPSGVLSISTPFGWDIWSYSCGDRVEVGNSRSRVFWTHGGSNGEA